MSANRLFRSSLVLATLFAAASPAVISAGLIDFEDLPLDFRIGKYGSYGSSYNHNNEVLLSAYSYFDGYEQFGDYKDYYTDLYTGIIDGNAANHYLYVSTPYPYGYGDIGGEISGEFLVPVGEFSLHVDTDFESFVYSGFSKDGAFFSANAGIPQTAGGGTITVSAPPGGRLTKFKFSSSSGLNWIEFDDLAYFSIPDTGPGVFGLLSLILPLSCALARRRIVVLRHLG